MPAPDLSLDDVKAILNDDGIVDIGEPRKGGQKLVVPIITSTGGYMAKFVEADHVHIEHDENEKDIIIGANAALDRLHREINILKSCDCNNLVKALSDGLIYVNHNERPILYYTEELVDGFDVQDLLTKEHQFSTQDVVHFAICINNAISSLWACEIIHRDIKPRNIIYDDKNNRFVLIDPGVAFDLQDASLTMPGFIVGTLEFMSPEQLRPNERRSLDFRSDHFLLGICMYHLLTHRHPFFFNANSIRDVHSNITNNRHQSLIEIMPNMPIKLSKLIDRLLAKEPHMRYRNTKLLESDLLQIKSEIGQ